MLVAGFPADVFGTNCYVLATSPGESCIVIDPGMGIVDRLDAVLAEHRLRPAAVVLTHGHLDHTFSTRALCDEHRIPVYVHPDDRAQLADPGIGIPGDLRAMFGPALPSGEPDEVIEVGQDDVVRCAGLELRVDHLPGHTPGSVLLHLDGDDGVICLSGDVLFAGSVGRTDLPGGDGAAMLTSLREKILPLDDAVAVLPGHGPATTIGRERATNPFLRGLGGSAR